MSGKGTNPASLKAIEPHRFKKGHKGGPGNPLAAQVNQLRAALAGAVTPADIAGIAQQLITEAKDGNVAAAHELFDRLFGKAKQPLEVTGKDGRSVKIKHVFDLERFAAELVSVERERSAAAGRMVPANGN